jgi:hypothetical protein
MGIEGDNNIKNHLVLILILTSFILDYFRLDYSNSQCFENNFYDNYLMEMDTTIPPRITLKNILIHENFEEGI